MQVKIGLVTATVVLILLAGYSSITQKNSINSLTKPNSTQKNPNNNPPPIVTPSSTVFPMTNYDSRLTERVYSEYFGSSSPNKLVCGGKFTGYHTSDDLEVTTTEVEQDVPIFAVANGVVRRISHVKGYGGLLIVESVLNNQTVTIYYGHISLTKTKVSLDQEVKAGQIVAYLGKQCSTETDGERKHLHFAIHQGNNIDLRGYVPTTILLGNWLDPKALLDSLKAINPTP